MWGDGFINQLHFCNHIIVYLYIKNWLKTQHSKTLDNGIQSHHFMANRWEKSWNSDRFYFLELKITVDSDCRHEIKRHLLLGRKAMTNPGTVLKNRDITFWTKVLRVKAVVFLVVIYRCGSWTMKKVESQRIDAAKLWCWRRHLNVPWTVRR